MKNPKIRINKFLLLGHRKNYDLPEFKEGLNIIHGTTDTGKSMILRLISYCLGKYKLSKRCPEIDNSCTHIVLELLINGEKMCIKRNIHKETKPIEIFFGDISKINEKPDKEFHITGTQKYTSISSFLLEKLRIPSLKVPYAPGDPNKGYNTISIKDVINLVYLNDEEIGAYNFLGMLMPSKHIKYTESLKALLKIESSEVQDLQNKRNSVNKDKNELKRYLDEVKKFLLDNNLVDEGDLESNMKKAYEEVKQIENKIKEINNQIQSDSYSSRDISNEILSKKEILTNLQYDIKITERNIVQFNELLLSYKEDLNKKEALLEACDLVGNEPKTCPLCHSLIEGETKLDRNLLVAELAELKHKLSDLNEVIKENSQLLSSMHADFNKESRALEELERENSELFKTFLSPLLVDRDNSLMELGKKQEAIRFMDEKIRIIRDYETKLHHLNKLNMELQELDLKLEKLKKNIKNKENVVKLLSKYFAGFIQSVGQLSADNPYINKNFIPHISIQSKDLSYYQIPGTAKKVVLTIAYYTAILKYSLLNDSFLPNLLIIDGPSSGRGTNPEDPAEAFDIKVFNNMFDYWVELINENKESMPQIIIVDNTLPPSSVKERILISFDTTGKDGARKGLIDDI